MALPAPQLRHFAFALLGLYATGCLTGAGERATGSAGDGDGTEGEKGDNPRSSDGDDSGDKAGDEEGDESADETGDESGTSDDEEESEGDDVRVPEFSWSDHLESDSSVRVSGLRVTEDGGVYVSGSFVGEMTVGGEDDRAAPVKLVSAGGEDVFLLRYDAKGALEWARAIGGRGREFQAHTLVPTPEAGIAMLFEFEGETRVGAGSSEQRFQAVGARDLIVANFDIGGELKFARAIGGLEADLGGGLVFDDDGGVWLAGSFTDRVALGVGDSDEWVLEAHGKMAMFLAELDDEGQFVDAQSMAGDGLVRVGDLQRSKDGALSICGFFSGEFDLGEGSGERLSAEGDSDIFVARFDDSGQLEWVRSAGGVGIDEGSSLSPMPGGGVVVTGTVSRDAVFGLGEDGETKLDITPADNDRETDLFVAAFDDDGDLDWVRSGGGSSWDSGNRVAVSDDDMVIVVGDFSHAARLRDDDHAIDLEGDDSIEIYMAAYDLTGQLLWAQAAGGEGPDRVWALATGDEHEVYIAGEFAGELRLSIGATDPDTLRSGDYGDGYVAGLDLVPEAIALAATRRPRVPARPHRAVREDVLAREYGWVEGRRYGHWWR